MSRENSAGIHKARQRKSEKQAEIPKRTKTGRSVLTQEIFNFCVDDIRVKSDCAKFTAHFMQEITKESL